MPFKALRRMLNRASQGFSIWGRENLKEKKKAPGSYSSSLVRPHILWGSGDRRSIALAEKSQYKLLMLQNIRLLEGAELRGACTE